MDLIKTARGVDYLTQNAVDDEKDYGVYASELEGMASLFSIADGFLDYSRNVLNDTLKMYEAVKNEDDVEAGSMAGKIARESRVVAAAAVHLAAAAKLYLECFGGGEK